MIVLPDTVASLLANSMYCKYVNVQYNYIVHNVHCFAIVVGGIFLNIFATCPHTCIPRDSSKGLHIVSQKASSLNNFFMEVG